MTRYLLTAALLCSAVPAIMPRPAPNRHRRRHRPVRPACARCNIYDFKPVPGNRSLIVIDRARQRYRVNFIGQCYDLQYPLGLRFKTFGISNLSCVVQGRFGAVARSGQPGPSASSASVQYQTPALDQQDAAAAAAANSNRRLAR